MSGSYQTSFDSGRSPINNSPASASSTLAPDSFKTNLNRTKSKRWVEAATVNYDDLWGDDEDYDSGSDGDYQRGARLPDRRAPVSHTEAVARSPASAAPAPAALADGPLPHGMKFPPPPSEIDMVLPPTPSEIDGREGTKQALSAVHVGHTSAPSQQMNVGPSSPQSLGHRAMPTAYKPSPSVDSAYSQKLREELQKRLSVRKPVPSRSSLPSSPAFQASSQQPLAAYPPNVPPLSDSSGGHYAMGYQGQYGHSPGLPAANEQLPLQSPPEAANLRAAGFPIPQSTPDYERYESPSSLCGRPKSADNDPLRPSILPTSQQPSSFSAEPVSISPTSPTPPSNPRIIRPLDIYRRHQEEQMRQSSVDSTAVGGVGSSPDEQRHPTRGESMHTQQSSEAACAPLLLRARASQEDVHRHASSQQWKEQGSCPTSAASPSSPARPRSRSGGSHPPSPLQPPANPLPNVPLRLVSPGGGSSPSSPLSRSESTHSSSPHPPPVASLPDVTTPVTPSLPETSWSRPQVISGFAVQTERASSTDLPSAILPPQGGLDEPEEKNRKAKDPLPGTLPPEDNACEAGRGEAEKVVDEVPKAAPLDGINTDYTPTKNSGDTEEKDVGSPVANDVIYETPLETTDHQDYFTPPTGQSRLPSTTTIPLARGSEEPGREVFQTLVDHAFVRQDTFVPTPYSETPPTDMSPIIPPPQVSPKGDSGDDVSSPAAPPAITVQNVTPSATEKDLVSAKKVNSRNPSPDSLREGVNKFSVMLPPVHTEVITGELSETTPVSGTSSPHETPVSEESDELDHFIGELERAQTPVPQSPSITPTPSEHATTYPKSSTWQDPNRLSISSRSPSINPISQDELEEHRRSPGQDQSFLSDSRSLSMKPASLHEEEDRPLSTQKERDEPGAPHPPRTDSPLHEEPEKRLQTSAEVRDYSDAPRFPGITSASLDETAAHAQPSAPVYDHLGVSISTEDKTIGDSLGVLLYGSYWRDGDDDSVGGAPLPVPPKSPRRVAAAEGPSPMVPSSQGGLVSRSEFEAPKKSSPPPPVTIPPPQETGSAMPAEPQTPASILDQDLLELVSTGKRFLDRRDTVLVPREKTRQEDSVTPQRLPAGPEPGGMETIHFTKNLGPESEGIEAIGGPVVEKRPKVADELNSPAENDFTRELISQFSRPQTLMLKQTMPSGIVMMPPMSPVPGGKSPADESAPEVINFEKDYGEGIEVLDDVALDDRKAPPSDKTVAAKTSTAVIQDTRLIPALDSPEERIMAYDALRNHIRESPNPLADWISYQLEHNNGNELLDSEIVSIKPSLAPRKSKGRMGGLGHFPSRSGDGGSRHEEGAANRAEEKLEKMGRGAMRLGEMAGGRVGGWVKRVGKKGNSNKESTSETADHQMRDGSSIELDTPIGNRTRNASATSHSSTAVPERSTSVGSMSQHTLTLTAASPSPVNHPPPHPHIQTQFQPKPAQAPQVRPPLQSVNEPKQPTLSIHHQPSIAGSKSPLPHSVKSPPAPGPAYSPLPARTDSPSSPNHSGSSSAITARGVPLPLSAEDSPSASTSPLPGPAAKAAADKRKECSDDDGDLYSMPKRPVVLSQEQKPPLPVVAATPPIKESQDTGDGSDTNNTELHAAPDQPLGCETTVQNQDSMMRVRQSMPLIPRGISPISPLTVTPAPPQLQTRGPENIMPSALPQQDVSQRLSVIAVPPSPNPEVAHPHPQPNQQGPHGAEHAQRTPSVAHSQGHSPQSGQQMFGHGDQGPILQDPHAARSQQSPGPLPSPHPQTQQPQHQQQPSFSGQHPASPQTAHGYPAPPPSRGSTLAQTVSNGSGHPSGSSPSNSGKRVKRASFFGLGSKLDGMGRSVSAVSHPQPQPQQWQQPRQQQQHYPQGQPQGRPRGYSQDHHQAHSPPTADAPPQKMTKRGSFLKKIGGSKTKKQDEGAKPKGNRVFSDMFSRTSPPPNSTGNQPSSKSAKLTKARLVSGGSDGTRALAQPSSSEPKIYDPKTGQYMSFDQAISRSGSMHSHGVPQQPLGLYVSPSQEYAPPRPSIGGHSQHSGYQSPSATYPPGVPQQQPGLLQEMQLPHSPTADVQSHHSPVLSRQSSSYASPSPGQQPPQPISTPLQQSGHEEARQDPGTPYRQSSQMAHGVPHERMPPPPPPGSQHYQPKEQPQAHPQNYPDHNRYGASPHGLPQQQQQYHQYPHNQSPYAASPTHPHPAYQQQPSYQPEYQPPSGAPQLPPLPSGLVRQSTQSSLYNAVLAHRGSIAERRADNTPPPPSQHHQPQHSPTQFQQPTYSHSQQPSPQLSRAGTGISSVSGGELTNPPSQQQQSYAPPPQQQQSYAPPPQQQQSYAPPPQQELSYSPPPQLHEEQQQHYAYTPRPPSATRERSGYAGYTSPVIPPPSAATASYHRSPPPPQQEQLERKQSVASNATRASGHAAPLFPQQPQTPTQSTPMPQRAQSVISTSTSVSGLSSGPGISRQGTHHSSLAHGVSSPHVGMSVNADTPASTGIPAAVIFVDSTNAGPGALLGSPANSVVYESAQTSDRYPVHGSDRPTEDEPVTTEVKAKVEQGTNGKEGDLDIKKREREQDADDETIGKGKGEAKVLERVEGQVEDYQGVRVPDTQHDKQEIQVQHGIQDEQAEHVAKADAIAGEASKEPAPTLGQEQPVEDEAAMGKHPSTAEPEEAAESTAAVIEEKIAVHYESNDGKEVVSAGHQRARSGGGASDGEGYSMSSTAYPGTWEPAYYGWS